MLGWVAPVNATESPSQLRPALIHRTWIKVSSAFLAASVSMLHSFPEPGWGPCGAGAALRPTCAALFFVQLPKKCVVNHIPALVMAPERLACRSTESTPPYRHPW